MDQEKCTKSNLEVSVRSMRKPRFKAGADLSSKVNRIAVDFNEELTDEHELVEITLVLSNTQCEASCEC